MMEIKNLEGVSFKDITEAFSAAFEKYFVRINADEEYLKSRWESARADIKLSFGAFDDGKLVGFIVHGIDNLYGIRTAYNAGTGVIPEYRGRGLVRQIYDQALPVLKQNNITQVILEVIQDNASAIKAYEKVGFKIERELLCFGGDVRNSGIKIENSRIDEFDGASYDFEHISDIVEFPLSWENSFEAISVHPEQYMVHELIINDELMGLIVFKPENGFIVLLVANDLNSRLLMLDNLVLKYPKIGINNVDKRDEKLISALRKVGLSNPINQYEMHLEL